MTSEKIKNQKGISTKTEHHILQRQMQYLLSRIGLENAPDEQPTDTELANVYKKIKNDQHLSHRPMDAMLVSTSKSKEILLLQCWVAAAAREHIESGRRPSTLTNACLRIRQLHEGKDPELKLFIENLPADLSKITTVFKYAHAKTTPKSPIYHRIGHLRALLDVYETKRTRKTPTKSVEALQPLARQSVPTLANDSGGDATLLRESTASDDDEPATAQVIVDVQPDSPKTHRQSLALQSHHAQTMGQRLTAQRMFSPCAWAHLSDYELDNSFWSLHKGALSGAPEDAVLLTVLLTGRSVKEVNCFKCLSLIHI